MQAIEIEEEEHITDTNSASVSDTLLTSNSNELYQDDVDLQMMIGNEPSVEANYVEDMLRSEGDTLFCCISVDVDDDDEEHPNESIFDRVVEEAGTSAAGSRQRTVSKHKQRWSEQYCELKIFFEMHDHCNVPKSYCKKLERWVKRQRGLMRKYEAGDEVGSISVSQYQLLQAIELDSAKKRLHNSEWEKMFKKLMDYREKDGHCQVPTKTSALGIWVSQQRSKYKARDLSGQASAIDWNEEHEHRYLRLKQIGFCFFVVLGSQNKKQLIT